MFSSEFYGTMKKKN